MKLIHCADIHLDAPFAAAGLPPDFGRRRRQAQRDTFRQILARAAAWPADAVLIAGDLFEHDRVSRETLSFLREAFEALRPIPVFIAPGNHDPVLPDSPYVCEAWPANVFIFRKPQWEAHALGQLPLTVHGFAFDGFDISRNPFGELHVPEDNRVHVALAHGSERAYLPPHQKLYASFDLSGALPPGLHYLALGHYHWLIQMEVAGRAPAWYPGTPEPLRFEEAGPRHFLEIELGEAPSTACAVRPVPCGQVEYCTAAVDCTAFTTKNDVVRALQTLATGERRKVAQVRLYGTCTEGLREQLDRVLDEVRPAFEALQIIDDTAPAEDYIQLGMQGTSLGLFVARLNRELADAPDEVHQRRLTRARELGLAAYRGRDIPVRSLEQEAP